MNGSVRYALGSLRGARLGPGVCHIPSARSFCGWLSVSRQQADTAIATSTASGLDPPASEASVTGPQPATRQHDSAAASGGTEEGGTSIDVIAAAKLRAREKTRAAARARGRERKAKAKALHDQEKGNTTQQPSTSQNNTLDIGARFDVEESEALPAPRDKTEESTVAGLNTSEAKVAPKVISTKRAKRATQSNAKVTSKDSDDAKNDATDQASSEKRTIPNMKGAAEDATTVKERLEEGDSTQTSAPNGTASSTEDLRLAAIDNESASKGAPPDDTLSTQGNPTQETSDAGSGRIRDVEAYAHNNAIRAAKRAEAKLRARVERMERKQRKEALKLQRAEQRKIQIEKEAPANVPTASGDERRATQHGGHYAPEQLRSRWSSKEDRASVNAATVEAGRYEQQVNGPESRFEDPTIPLGSGSGSYPMYLPFEHTKMVYPPSDVYPPPIPRLRDVDLDTAARALAVLRTSGVQWIQDKERRASVANGDSVLLGTGQWRSVVRDADWLVDHSEMDRLDSEQSLEYIGDSLLHLLSRSALMNRYPRRTMILYNIGANFLVSNDVFGHVYRDSGLDDERKIVAHLVQSRSKAAELNRVKDIISPQEYEERASMPLPPLAFPPIHHLRQADLFEAYVGGVYLTLGFNEASKWCTRLFQPWLDRLGRTPGFNAPRFLTPDGELHARLQLSMRNQVEQDLRDRSERELSKIGGMQKWLIRILQRVSGRQVYLDDRSKERV